MIDTVAVIGGSGFVGRATIEKLAKAGKKVIVLCRNSERAKFLKPMGQVGQIDLVAGDASDDKKLENVLSQAHAVVNMVGILAETRTQKFDRLQAQLPCKIGELASKYNHQAVVHLSAIGADHKSTSIYARTKAEGELLLKSSFPKAILLRPSIIFGTHDKFFNRFAAMAQVAPALPLPGGGEMKMQPVYVADVASAIVNAIGIGKVKLKRRPEGTVYELGGPDVFTFRQLMQLTLKYSQRKRLLVSVPFSVLTLGATFAELLPYPPLTRDQIRLLKLDNIVSDNARSLADIGVVPTSVEGTIPTYLARFRPGGLFRR